MEISLSHQTGEEIVSCGLTEDKSPLTTPLAQRLQEVESAEEDPNEDNEEELPPKPPLISTDNTQQSKTPPQTT